ncbi:hypothetical protein ABID22_001206 [Pontibacter aydingkolensis]|uniref:Uncharacterized protein n=1 Tax=Pontibacter aydingkolensis TaxID=1911536 RepID=A0ABS7CUF0_9BACT|nr:hypothetical protein [Pontibacter aydingkolensis]MBW7467112.1 hypothetical protein [Pontibacter aydingkolensis]
MIKLWQPVREFLPVVAVVLLCLIIVPVDHANGNSNGSNGATTITPQQNTTPAVTTAASSETTKTAKPKAKVTAIKPQNKSVLDTDVLDSPIGYFKKAFSSEEDEADAASNSGAVMITVKALIATLLSTIM